MLVAAVLSGLAGAVAVAVLTAAVAIAALGGRHEEGSVVERCLTVAVPKTSIGTRCKQMPRL